MRPDTIYHSLSSLLTLLIFLLLVFWWYRNYRVDFFRQRVFELRDRLFDDANGGLIAFDDPAYGILRSTMNGYIRFAHRLNMWFVLLTFLLIWKSHRSWESPTEKAWTAALERLDPGTRNKLVNYRAQLISLVLKHVLLASPEIYIILVPLGLIVLVLALVHWPFAQAGIFKTMNDTALAYGEEQQLASSSRA